MADEKPLVEEIEETEPMLEGVNLETLSQDINDIRAILEEREELAVLAEVEGMEVETESEPEERPSLLRWIGIALTVGTVGLLCWKAFNARNSAVSHSVEGEA